MMKIIHRLALCAALLSLLPSCYITRAWHHRAFALKDLPKFDSDTLPPSPEPWRFQQGTLDSGSRAWLDSNLAGTDTYSFLIIRNDTILYERYFNEVTQETKLPSFSVVKSWVSTLTGIAHDQGRIPDLGAPITTYLPELEKRDPRFRNITVQHLLDMRSGVKSSEEYSNPFSDVLKLGFTKNITPKALSVKYGSGPGEFDYKSVNTQLLAMVVEKATGMSIQEYMKRELWLPLGMEYEASWNIDSRSHGKARAFCCLNAATRDFAKLGRLMLKDGEWNGKQVVSSDWVRNSTALDSLEAYHGYHNQWWSEPNRSWFSDSASAVEFAKTLTCPYRLYGQTKPGEPRKWVVLARQAYHAEGLLGQFIYVKPSRGVIIVRTGHYWKHPQFNDTGFIYFVGSRF